MDRFTDTRASWQPWTTAVYPATVRLRSRTIPASMERERLESALNGLRGFGDADAIRASEHLECAVDHSEQRGKRWTEQMCYCLRECLEGIPRLFGQKKVAQPLGTAARQFTSEAIAVDLGLPRFDGQGWWLGQAACLWSSLLVAVSNSSGVR